MSEVTEARTPTYKRWYFWVALVVVLALLDASNDGEKASPAADDQEQPLKAVVPAAENRAPGQETVEDDGPEWTQLEACSFMDAKGLVAGTYRNHEIEYGCISGYKTVDDSGLIENTLLYDATGDATKVKKLLLRLDMFNSKGEGLSDLEAAAQALTEKATGADVPAVVFTAMQNGQSASAKSGAYVIKVSREKYKKGYGLRYIIEVR